MLRRHQAKTSVSTLTRAAMASIAVLVCQLATGEGANLFAPPWNAGKPIDAERALPLTSFYDTPTPDIHGEPGSLIRSEPANDYALPPAVLRTSLVPR
jgi:hypothetical protein